ncbi:unnamed protein product [Amaranthus hypochondriacus]
MILQFWFIALEGILIGRRRSSKLCLISLNLKEVKAKKQCSVFTVQVSIMTSSNWLNQQYDWIFNTNLSELSYSESHQNKSHDPLYDGINEQFCWVDDNKLSQLDEFMKFDSISEKLQDFFVCDDHDNKLFEFGESTYFENKSDFNWDDDKGLSPGGSCSCTCHQVDLSTGNIFEEVFEKLNEIFMWDDDIYSGNEFDPTVILEAGFSDNDVIEIDDKLHDLTCEPVKLSKAKQKILREEEDLYLKCRKEAFEMIDIAKRLSQERKNACAKGDHTSAKRLSEKAAMTWKAAHKLNIKAGQDILKTTNKKNGIMKIDLHGLHPFEAIQAVKKRLNIIETKPKTLCSSSKIGKPLLLEVITGVGKHSRGVAKLPTAVRTFLTDKGYQFNEGRPGVIMVRPKLQAT